MEHLKLYKSKAAALKNLNTNWILCNIGVKSYFQMENHEKFLELIQATKHPEFYEYISNNQPIKLFFDIDIKESHEYYNTPYDSITSIKETFGNEYILLQSHGDTKKSFHMIYPRIFFKNTSTLKTYLQSLNITSIDLSVYRTGIFRTVLSHKPKETRAFVFDVESPIQDDYLGTFITYLPEIYETYELSNRVKETIGSSSNPVGPSTSCNPVGPSTSCNPVGPVDYKRLNKTMSRPQDDTWDITKTPNGYKAIPGCTMCLVDPQKDHHPHKQSALFLNNDKTVVKTCFGNCGSTALTKKESKKITNVFNVYLNIVDEENTIYQSLQKNLIRLASKSGYKRERNTGMVYKPIRPYAYIKYKNPMDFLNEVFYSDDDFVSNVNNMDNLIKFMKQYDYEGFEFLQYNKDYIGFSNGVLEKTTCEFTDIPSKDLVVSKYFDHEFKYSLETPLMDKVLDYQFSEKVRDFIYMSLGRCFGIRDNFGYMLYLLGESGCGKSVIIGVLSECFNNIGSIGNTFEEKFGLSFLYDKDLIVCDDLPKHISKIFPQQTFQTCITGGKIPIAVKGGEGFSVDWKVPMLWAGNWYPDYICKGQIARRIVTANFEKFIETPDTTLQSQIISKELPAFIYKCLLYYKKVIDSNMTNDIWSICPEYFLEQKEDLKIERNPLYKFLVENTTYKENNMVLLEDIKNNFSSWLGKSVTKLDHGTFYQVNKKYLIKPIKVCKHCMKQSSKDCCDLYKSTDRLMKAVVYNIGFVSL